MSGNDSLVIGYPPRGRSGSKYSRAVQVCLYDMVAMLRERSGGRQALVSQQAFFSFFLWCVV